MRQVQKQEERFTREFLEKLPVVLESGEAVTAIVTAEYSIFLPEQVAAQSVVANYRWINHGWVRFLNDGYFDCEDGNSIREWFLEDHGQGNNAWKLVHAWNTRDVLSAIADKFKSDIRRRIIDLRNDLGFYDFISKCIDEGCINLGWVEQQLSGWPVLDGGEVIVESSDKVMFYRNSSILHWVNSGWLDDMVLVLNERYSAQKKLFDVLGAQEFEEGNFGEIFRTLLAPHLNLDSREKVIAFHRFMATKKESFVSTNQIEVLKRLPTLISGDENPTDGLDGVYLPTRIDIGSEIATGTISTEIKVLDDALCDDGTMEYWKWLGVKSLDEVEILKKRLEKYLERQKEFTEKGASDATFKEYHIGLINTLASIDVLQTLKDNGCGDLIKKVRLFSKSGKLLSPTEMKWSNEYQPLCDFESFNSGGVYTSEMYCGVEGIKELFKELGVKDKFSKSDVALLANKEFCEYFWKKYLPLNESEWDKVKDYLNADLPCVLDRRGVVRKPEELYHLEIEDYVLKLPDSESKLPMMDGMDKNRLSQIEMKTALSVEDSLAFLLADSDCEMYKMRGKVLEWIAKGSVTASHDLVDKYRSDERAKWRNGQKDPVSVKELCAIRRKNSGQVRLFASDPHVMDLTGLGIGGDGADAMRAEVENALVWLGVQLVDDGSIEIEPANKLEISDQVISDIALRMLVFLAERYPDGWGTEFTEMYARLKILKFLKCSGLVVRCKDNEWLRAEHGTFLCKDDRFYFVDDWQSKFVYGDMVSRLWEKVCKKQYSLDDLKMALDTGDGDYQFSKRIALDKKSLLSDGQFVQKLQEQFPKVHSMIYDRLRELERAPTPSTDSENYGQGVVEGIQSSGEEKEQGEAPLHEPETKKNYSDDEQEQMCRVFGNDLTPEQMNDINRIDCIRLFNNLMSKGLKPKYLLGGNDQMEKEYGDSDEACERDFVQDMFGKKQSKRKVDHSATIETNDGRIIHVVGAINGVAHLPPRWWTRLANQIDRGSAKYVVCAVVYHRDDGFQYLETKGDLMDAIGDRFTVVRVQSESREERFIKTVALFNSDPECSDYSTYSLLLLHKMKSDRSYECVFTKEFGNETINEW